MNPLRPLLLALALNCAACALPDTYGITGGYGQGSLDPDSNDRTSYDSDQWIGLLTVGWSPGDRRRQDDTLKAIRRLEIATVTGQVQPLPVAQESEHKDLIDHVIPDIPQTEEESWNLLRWAGAILVLAVAALVLHFAGLRLPFFKKTEP